MKYAFKKNTSHKRTLMHEYTHMFMNKPTYIHIHICMYAWNMLSYIKYSSSTCIYLRLHTFGVTIDWYKIKIHASIEYEYFCERIYIYTYILYVYVLANGFFFFRFCWFNFIFYQQQKYLATLKYFSIDIACLPAFDNLFYMFLVFIVYL